MRRETRRGESGYDGYASPVNRPRASTPMPSNADLEQAGLRRWSAAGVTGWTTGCPIEAAKAAERRVEQARRPGEMVGKLREIVARFGEDDAAKRLEVGVPVLRKWMANGGPSKSYAQTVLRLHYSIRNRIAAT